jgi:hypothetical protein
MLACDFFTVETLWLGCLYVLFFLELGARRGHLAGCTANPDGRWTTQQARQLAWSLAERVTPIRFLLHDRDRKFSRAFDEVFRSGGRRDHPHPVSGAGTQTRSRSAGSERSAATASTGSCSQAADNSSTSCASTSTTTTDTHPTEHST